MLAMLLVAFVGKSGGWRLPASQRARRGNCARSRATVSMRQNADSDRSLWTAARIGITDSTLFSKSLYEPSGLLSKIKRSILQRPCVVFFPGDVSDLASNRFAIQQKQWSLEALHNIMAGRFPECDVLTVRGELNLDRTRSFKMLTENPLCSIDCLKSLLFRVQGKSQGKAPLFNLFQSKLILVGFSRGGVALTALIDGAEADTRFWKRVEAIHYVDVGGDGSFVSDKRGLGAVARSNGQLWFNFPCTRWTYCARYAEDKKRMIGLVEDVKLRVQAEEFPVNSFPEHFDVLSFFKVKYNRE